jgi:DNA replication licensing factor MCM6
MEQQTRSEATSNPHRPTCDLRFLRKSKSAVMRQIAVSREPRAPAKRPMQVVGEHAAPPPPDESADAVQRVFETFLLSYDSNGDGVARYVRAMQAMVAKGDTTLYIDMEHVFEHEHVLGEYIIDEYYRFEPFLRRALTNVVAQFHREYLKDDDRGARTFWISFFNVATAYRVRQLTTNKIGRLARINGTVTRTSDVRPELLFGSFSCVACGTAQTGVPQQHRYSEPLKCRNSVCQNVNKWTIDMSTSQFVDWQVGICAPISFQHSKALLQRVRVQENPDEIPSGALPRSIDVIMRHEQVKRCWWWSSDLTGAS